MNALDRLASALALLATATAVRGQMVLYVDASAPAGGTGADWSHAFADLQDALDAASVPGSDAIEVRVAQGLYTPTANPGWPGFQFPTRQVAGYMVTSAVSFSMLGSFGGRRSPTPDARDFVNTRTVLSGDVLGDDTPDFGHREDNVGPVLALNGRFAGQVYLDGLTVTAGHASVDWILSGGISCAQRIPPWAPRVQIDAVIERCTLMDNLADDSVGGLGLFGPVMGFLRGSRFEGNAGALAGGASGFIADIERSTFIANDGHEGGGVQLDLDVAAFPGYPFPVPPTSSLEACVFLGNHADVSGGGIHADSYWTVSVRNSVIASNHAGLRGGGLTAGRCEAVFTTIAHNTSDWSGGMHVNGGGSSVSSSIVWGNSALRGGSQVGLTESVLRLERSVVQGGIGGILAVFGSEVIGPPFTFDPEWVDSDGTDGNPATWHDNDLRLRTGSPCIDASLLVPSFDQRDVLGNPRRRGTLADLGAYEFQPCDPDFNNDGSVDQADFEYLVAVIAGGHNPTGANSDFNRDGSSDQSDLWALVEAIAGGACP